MNRQNCMQQNTSGLNSLPRVALLFVFLLLGAAHAFSASEKGKKKADDGTPTKPFISTLFPAGGQRGKTVEIVVSGSNLVSGSGSEITGSPRVTGAGMSVRIITPAEPKSCRLAVSIGPDAEIGEHDVRFVTPGGISNRARFFVGQLPELNEAEPNSDIARPQALPPLPVLVNGRIDQSDRDFYRFSVKAGQVIVCEIQARAIVPFIADAVPGWFDAVLTLYDNAGKPLQTVNGFHLKPDPVLIFTAARDGEYILGIRDVIYRGRADFVYRLSIGQLPYITHVFPLGGKRDSMVPVELHGVNLPEAVHQSAFSNDPNPRRSLNVSSPNGFLSNRVMLAAGDLPETLETEPNDSMPQAQRITLPLILNGRIQTRSDADWFVFTAKAGEKLSMSVLARRLGSPLDSILTLFNAKSAELMENDDTVDPAEPLATHHADSYLAYTIPTAGDYYLRIKDAQQKGGDDFGYRLTIAPPQPDFTLRVTSDNPSVGQGDSSVITVEALRKDGFTGEIPLTITELPPGFVVSGTTGISANQDDVSITVTIPPNAPLTNFTPVIFGNAKIGERSVVRRASAAEAVMQAFASTHNVFTKELILSITEPPSISISTAVQTGQILELPQGGELQIKIKVVRRNDLKGGITLNAQRPATNNGKPRPNTGITTKIPFLPADKDESILTLNATKQAPLGTVQNIIVVGTLKSGKITATSIAPAIPVKIVPSEIPKTP